LAMLSVGDIWGENSCLEGDAGGVDAVVKHVTNLWEETNKRQLKNRNLLKYLCNVTIIGRRRDAVFCGFNAEISGRHRDALCWGFKAGISGREGTQCAACVTAISA
jgi:hypothetical protein